VRSLKQIRIKKTQWDIFDAIGIVYA
jgi:hypothetical protein